MTRELRRARKLVKKRKRAVARWSRLMAFSAKRWRSDGGSRTWAGRLAFEVGRRASVRRRMAQRRLERAEHRVTLELMRRDTEEFARRARVRSNQ